MQSLVAIHSERCTECTPQITLYTGTSLKAINVNMQISSREADYIFTAVWTKPPESLAEPSDDVDDRDPLPTLTFSSSAFCFATLCSRSLKCVYATMPTSSRPATFYNVSFDNKQQFMLK